MLSEEEIIDLNKNLPISLESLQDLIDRVSIRYPFIGKFEIALIIKSFFEKMRSVVVSGDVLSIHRFFSRMHIISFSRIRKDKFYFFTKMKLSTPKGLKE